MNESTKNDSSSLKRELLEFLEDLPVMPENFQISKQAESSWGRQHTETLFRRMLHDREFLQLLIWESIAPKIVDLSNFSCLFSRYTCFKFFERYADAPFWFCCHLMGIPEQEMIEFFAVADLRHVFGSKIVENLFEQLRNCRPNFNLRDFNDLCLKFNRDHCEMRRRKLAADARLEISKRNLIHFDSNRQDYGLLESRTSTITYSDPIILETENLNADTTGNDDLELSQKLTECFKNEEEEGEEEDENDDSARPVVPAVSMDVRPYAERRLDYLKKARESKAAKRRSSTAKNKRVLEMPAFSVQDLEKFEDEDPYVSYALAFACCDDLATRMARVKDVLERELETAPKKAKVDSENELLALEKLRQLACFFAPKNSQFDAQNVLEMSKRQLLDLNLNQFAKACETEFAKIIDESKRNLREKFQMQICRYQKLLLKMVEVYQPENDVGRRGETGLNILTLEREISKFLKNEEQKTAPKIECFVDLNENIVDIKNEEEFIESDTVADEEKRL